MITIEELLIDIPKKELISLVNDENRTFDSIDLNNQSDVCYKRVFSAIQDAQEIISGYLGQKYALPFTVIPMVVKKLCRTITRYYLYARRFPENPYQEAYNQSIKQLRDIANGDLSLGINSPSNDEYDGIKTNKNVTSRFFTLDTMQGY